MARSGAMRPLRSRVSSRPIRAALLGLAAVAASCEPALDEAAVSGPEVRDSAGITIVENRGEALASWRLSEQPLVVISDGDGPIEQTPLDPTAVFEGVDGRIIVGDGNQAGWHAVLVYDADGDFLLRLGGPGRGPGEFGGQLWWTGPYRGDSIVAWDRRGPSGPSMKIFGPDGGYSRDVSIPNLQRPRPEGTVPFSVNFHGAFEDGRLLTSSDGVFGIPDEPGPSRFNHLLLAVRPDGSARDTIGEFELGSGYWDGQDQSSYLFGPRSIIRPHGNHILVGTGDTYEYRILDTRGGPIRIVRKEARPVPVTADGVDRYIRTAMEAIEQSGQRSPEQLEQVRQRLASRAAADTMPPYSNILVDGAGNVWVERYRWSDVWGLPPDPTPTTWDVFDHEGRLLADVVVPEAVILMSVAAGRAYGMRIDGLGARQVVVYGVSR